MVQPGSSPSGADPIRTVAAAGRAVAKEERGMVAISKRAVVTLLGAVMLLGILSTSAQARPMYWYAADHTGLHGWIVKAGNDSWTTTIRTSCHWYANGSRWHLSWRIPPRKWYWTTSDAGDWGDAKPQSLSCTYVRL
jgi:hypothetical protein